MSIAMSEPDDKLGGGRKVDRSPPWRGLLAVVVLTSLFLGLFAGLGRYRFGSFARARAYVRGDRLFVDDRDRSIGDIRAGTKLTLQYAVTNLTGHPVRLLGARPSCSCTVVDDLPATLAALETRSIPVVIDTSERVKEALTGTVDIFTDEPRSQTLRLAFAGRIVADRAPDSGAGR
jgi:hypothetical protein